LNRINSPISIKNGNNQHPAHAGIHATRIKQMIAHECSSKIDKNYKTINRKIQKRRLYLLNDAK
jgi:N-acetylmuramoyl-L-alanine amidase